MNWWGYLLTGLSVLCTAFSILGAYKSNKYYRKSKALTNYANTNIAYIESQKIVSILTEILKLANNSRRQRGTNYLKEVSEYAEKIKNSINKIRDSLPPDDCKEIFDLLNSGENRVERYFDSLIAGTAFPDQKFMLDEQFYTCQTAVHNMQLLLKEKLDSTGEKLK